jgi:hypothetical protein
MSFDVATLPERLFPMSHPIAGQRDLMGQRFLVDLCVPVGRVRELEYETVVVVLKSSYVQGLVHRAT